MNINHLQDYTISLSKKKHPRILLGLSGGADSTFLFSLLLPLHDKQITLACAHLNHGWRTDADKDEAFVQKLCAQHNIELFTSHAQDLNGLFKKNGSQEALGRAMRRHFFEKTLHTWQGDAITLAHHADDQQETFMLRLMRGASLTGLTCMQPRAGAYIRPLLGITKKNILSYLQTNNISFVHDESNNSEQFLRNRIRNQILPAMQECDPRFSQKFTSTLSHLQDTHAFITQLAHETYARIFPTPHKGDLYAFKALHPFMQKQLLMLMLQAHNATFSPSNALLNEMLRFLQNPRGGTHTVHTTWALHKKTSSFWLTQEGIAGKTLPC